MSGAVIREVKRVTLCVVALTAVMLLIFAVAGHFNLPVLYGALLGCAVSAVNFLVMSFTVEKSMERSKGGAGSLMALSYFIRLALIAAAVVWAIKAPYFNYLAAVIPLVFIRLSVYILNFSDRKGGHKN